MPAVPTTPLEVSVETLPRKRFTRQEVECLLQTDFFAGQRYELIDGVLVDKMGQNPPHAYAIQLLLGWLASVFEIGIVRVQHPMQAAPGDSERSLPEPDIAVLRENKAEFQRSHPRGDEMLLVIEVSDSTAAFDLSRKMTLYARAGVPEYWVLDLNRRMLVAHRESDGTQYRHIHMFAPEDSVSLQGRSERVKVENLLPQP